MLAFVFYTGYCHPMNENQKTSFLGNDRIFPLLMKMGIPAAIGMLVNALYNVVDTIFVGLGVGSLAIAALAIVFPLQMLVSSFAQAIGFGASSIVSRRLGEKRSDEASAVMGTAYSGVAISTLVLIALVYIFMDPLLRIFGATETILPLAREYLMLVSAGFLFFALSMAANSLLRAEGNAKASMHSMVLGAALNCALDPLFIFAFRWGIRGAAAATIISQMASCAYILMLYAQKKNHVAIHAKDFRIKGRLLAESGVLGIPSFVQEVGMSILAMVVNNALRHYGGDQAITIYGMVTKFVSIIFLPMIGIIQGFQPIAGYNFGARRLDRVRMSVRVTIATAVAFASLSYIFTMGLPSLCMSLFTHDKELILAAAHTLRINTLFLPLVAVQIVGGTFFLAIGKPTQSLILGLSRQFIILIPLLAILPHFWGLDGVWWSFPVSDLLATMVTTGFLVHALRKLERTAPVSPVTTGAAARTE